MEHHHDVANMAPSDSSGSLDSIIQQITTSNNIRTLDQTLRNSLPKEARETILASMLPGGQDPLAILDPRVNTLGFLYILCALTYCFINYACLN